MITRWWKGPEMSSKWMGRKRYHTTVRGETYVP